MGPQLDVHIIDEGDTTVVIAKGDVDIATADAFRGHLVPTVTAAPDRVVLDMSSVGFLDSTGIGVIVEARRVVRDRGHELHLVPSRRVLAALRLAALDQALVLHDNLQSALGATGDIA